MQAAALEVDVVPFQIHDLGAAVASDKKKVDGGDGLIGDFPGPHGLSENVSESTKLGLGEVPIS
ncbi:MAG: hypothetical protein AAGA65_26490 [Actinomycetota bacterium]